MLGPGYAEAVKKCDDDDDARDKGCYLLHDLHGVGESTRGCLEQSMAKYGTCLADASRAHRVEPKDDSKLPNFVTR